MLWIKTVVHTTTAGIEPVSGILLLNGINGYEVCDSEDFNSFLENKEVYFDYIEDDLLKLKDCETTVTFYVPENSQGLEMILAIKNALADRDAVPTVIYDEIDSGVSGKAAGRIGEVLRQSAQGHQILCITHTAQIAALADCHLLIQKNVTNDRTYTEIHPLDTEGRVEALARLISGDHVTELSRANAREMLGTGCQ